MRRLAAMPENKIVGAGLAAGKLVVDYKKVSKVRGEAAAGRRCKKLVLNTADLSCCRRWAAVHQML